VAMMASWFWSNIEIMSNESDNACFAWFVVLLPVVALLSLSLQVKDRENCHLLPQHINDTFQRLQNLNIKPITFLGQTKFQTCWYVFHSKSFN
jgi:hypothetical protein